jgi:hypothetical protein
MADEDDRELEDTLETVLTDLRRMNWLDVEGDPETSCDRLDAVRDLVCTEKLTVRQAIDKLLSAS